MDTKAEARTICMVCVHLLLNRPKTSHTHVVRANLEQRDNGQDI